MAAALLLFFRKSLITATVFLLLLYTLKSLLKLAAGKHQKMRTLRRAGILYAYIDGEEVGAISLEKGDFLLGNKIWVPEPNYIRAVEGRGRTSPWLVRLEIRSSGMTLTVLEGEAEAGGRILVSGSSPVRTRKFVINGCTYSLDQ